MTEQPRAEAPAHPMWSRPSKQPQMPITGQAQTARDLRHEGLTVSAIAVHMRLPQETVVRLLSILGDAATGADPAGT